MESLLPLILLALPLFILVLQTTQAVYDLYSESHGLSQPGHTDSYYPELTWCTMRLSKGNNSWQNSHGKNVSSSTKGKIIT